MTATNQSSMQLPSQATLRTSAGDSVVTLAAVAGLSKSKAEVGPGVRCVRLTLVNVVLTLSTATSNVAFVGTKLFDFAEGAFTFLGGVANLTTAGDGSAVAATAPLVWAVGTVTASNNATLTSTEADLIPSTAGTLVASAGTFANTTVAAPANFAGMSGTPKSAFLNLAGDNTTAAVSSGAGTVTVNGTIDLFYVPLGDNAN